jgi:hypothetical protein
MALVALVARLSFSRVLPREESRSFSPVQALVLGFFGAPRKALFIQWMRDPPQQLSVRLGSYPDERASNRMDEASGTKGHIGDSRKSVGCNASEA